MVLDRNEVRSQWRTMAEKRVERGNGGLATDDIIHKLVQTQSLVSSTCLKIAELPNCPRKRLQENAAEA